MNPTTQHAETTSPATPSATTTTVSARTAPTLDQIRAFAAAGGALLYAFIDMSKKTWKVAFSNKSKERVVTVPGGDFEKFTSVSAQAKDRLKLPAEAEVVVVYEAGQDGFFPHRRFTEMGLCCLVVDPASIEISQRKRNVKTDRRDAMKGVRILIRYIAGEQKAWSVVRIPTVAEEDSRRNHRERERLVKERISHSNRIRSLMTLHGVHVSDFKSAKAAVESAPVPAHQKAELKREYERQELVSKQIAVLEDERDEMLAKPTNRILEMVTQLMQLKGFGVTSAWLLVHEFFGWRKFANRREVGGAAGLGGTPFDSGEGEHEQGISKAGNRRVRSLLIELAWGWLRYQPDSALTRWFMHRWAVGKRGRRIGIVALARRILVDVWRYLERGVIPAGAILKVTK